MQSKGPICQSCAMPLEKAEMFGTTADGSRSPEYCSYCFQDGKFIDPGISMQQMIDKCVAIMATRKIMSESEARGLMSQTIPMLKRWKRT